MTSRPLGSDFVKQPVRVLHPGAIHLHADDSALRLQVELRSAAWLTIGAPDRDAHKKRAAERHDAHDNGDDVACRRVVARLLEVA